MLFILTMLSLKTLAPTVLKARPLQSSALAKCEKFNLKAEESLALSEHESGHRNHHRIRLSEPINDIPIWYAYYGHTEIWQSGKAIATPQTTLNKVKLNVPYKSQLDNYYNPTGSCNVTSIAMCLEYLGVPRYDNRFRQLEDELYQWCIDKGYSRHSPQDLAQVVRDYKRKDDFTVWGTIEHCQDHLRGGNPCVIHGYFTSFGHIIVLVGFDENGFIVHDPYGEWFASGYDTSRSGAFLHYSYDLIRHTCIPDGQFWVHYISR